MSGGTGLYSPGGHLEPELHLFCCSCAFNFWLPMLPRVSERLVIKKQHGRRRLSSGGPWSIYSGSDLCPSVRITLARTQSHGHASLHSWGCISRKKKWACCLTRLPDLLLCPALVSAAHLPLDGCSGIPCPAPAVQRSLRETSPCLFEAPVPGTFSVGVPEL